ncbi:GyrI-like domain-containing protein [Isoptericola sp. S6320L]|uniref:GyrI-like domain-containing protein n=1 Tax=Isoptericola sp. S6320L TaxID=2926411 RepID=UPI001FF1FF3D|nr:GyrI-like domain-containing protein [Isoptericola sp. S6320L]MCK0118644.1 GyrI-like domain-containing protein [Isoptericola sp. S6320L]
MVVEEVDPHVLHGSFLPRWRPGHHRCDVTARPNLVGSGGSVVRRGGEPGAGASDRTTSGTASRPDVTNDPVVRLLRLPRWRSRSDRDADGRTIPPDGRERRRGEDTTVDDSEIRLIDQPGQATVGVRRIARPEDLSAVFATLIPRVAGLLDRLGVQPAGPPYGRYRDRPGDGFDVEVGFPVDGAVDVSRLPQAAAPDAATDAVVTEPLPATRAVEAIHIGPYDRLPATYDRLASWITEHRLHPLGQSWELYESGPDSDPRPATWRTRVVVAVTGPEIEPARPPSGLGGAAP